MRYMFDHIVQVPFGQSGHPGPDVGQEANGVAQEIH